jgi:class 3 adenylate cyclase
MSERGSKALALGQYEAAFRENGIDDTVLPSLTAEDLKDLGVGIAGHRRRLLDAIAALHADSTLKARPPARASTPPSTAVTAATSVAEATGERRHVTVMFCDLVNSTGIAAKRDAEESRDLVSSYLDAASAVVTEMGGKVAKKLGDGLMALFGYPVAQENDAERAARAAIAVQRALAELNRKNAGTRRPALAARIAIDSGPVVVDATGEILGEVPSIAARAQALAEPGAVVVTARVRRRVAGLFVAKERGSLQLKGVSEPVTLYRLIRPSGGGRPMTDYYPLIVRAVEGLDRSTGEARRALYERARNALVAKLRSNQPPLLEADITKERLALEEAIRKAESDAQVANGNTDGAAVGNTADGHARWRYASCFRSGAPGPRQTASGRSARGRLADRTRAAVEWAVFAEKKSGKRISRRRRRSARSWRSNG